MENSKKILYLIITLILLLILFNILLTYREYPLKRDCKEKYDVNGSCPCKKLKIDNLNLSNVLNYNVNKSIYK